MPENITILNGTSVFTVKPSGQIRMGFFVVLNSLARFEKDKVNWNVLKLNRNLSALFRYKWRGCVNIL